MPRILIIDDDDNYAQLASSYLRISGMRDGVVVHAASTSAAIHRLKDFPADIVFLDNRIPPQRDFRSGLKALREAGYEGPVIVQSACTADDVFEEARQLGAAEVIDKFHLDDVMLVNLLRKHAPRSLN